MNNFFRISVTTALSVALASCTALPRSGPDHGSIVKNAAVHVDDGGKALGYQYALIDLSSSVLPYFNSTLVTSLVKGFGGTGGAAPSARLGVGDVVEISIFEAQSGGLFIPQEAGSRPGNYITLPAQSVGSDGNISVPYAGTVRAAGRDVSDVEREIEDNLANRAIEPQVVITTTTSRSDQVAVLGDVNNPAKMSLSPAGERILDVLARAGGLSTPGVETYVTVERGGRKATARFATIVSNSKENIYLRPGDTVYVSRERRTYVAIGATGLNGRFNFEESNLTLAEALGAAGGLIDSRADPREVFLYRSVSRKTLEDAGVDVTKFAGDTVPTVFRANLRDPAIFFAVKEFKMQDKDIVYVSNSASTEVTKFLNLVNNVSNTHNNVTTDALSTRNAIRNF